MGLYKQVRGIFSCLYEGNPDSMLWNSKEIGSDIRKLLQTARIIYLLKKSSFTDSSDSEPELWDLSKQIADCFYEFHKIDEYVSDFEQILLEICHPKEPEEESVTQKKLRAFVRAFSFKDTAPVSTLLRASESLADKFNFDFLIIKEVCKHVIPKSSEKVKDVLYWIKKKRQVNAYIDYCLELPLELQTAQLSALLHSDDLGNPLFSRYPVMFRARKLNPRNYPKLTQEAYQEAFSSRNL